MPHEAKIIQFPEAKIPESLDDYFADTKRGFDDYWGVCPRCHRNDRYLSDGAENWMVCNRHKLKWCVGENVFSGWRHLSVAEAARQTLQLSTYNTVDPVRGLWTLRRNQELASQAEEDLAEWGERDDDGA